MRVAEAVNTLDADVIVHAGDISDGTLTRLGLADRPVTTVDHWRCAGRCCTPEAAPIAASLQEGRDGHGA